MENNPTTQIEQELYLYFCAGGHTRAAMAEAALVKAGFKFGKRPSGMNGPIAWPDGKPIEMKGGNIVYRGFSEKKLKACQSCGLTPLDMGNPDNHDGRCALAALIFQAAVNANERGQADMDQMAVLDGWGEYEIAQGRIASQERAKWAALEKTELAIKTVLREAAK